MYLEGSSFQGCSALFCIIGFPTGLIHWWLPISQKAPCARTTSGKRQGIEEVFSVYLISVVWFAEALRLLLEPLNRLDDVGLPVAISKFVSQFGTTVEEAVVSCFGGWALVCIPQYCGQFG